MILKASQRGGGRQLAAHLMNEQENDRIEILQIRGTIAQDLHGAFMEWEAQSKGTNCRKYIYSLSINPDPRQRELSREEYEELAVRVGLSLGLSEQPHAIVFHTKKGRTHAHIAWSRIDTDRMKAIQLSHDRRKLRAVVREFARERQLELPKGLTRDRDPDRFKDRARYSNLAEKQQEERTGITKQERMTAVAAAFAFSIDGKSFSEMLAKSGYTLARGRKGRIVIVDRAGEIHSLSRQLPNAGKKELKARVAALDNPFLPDAVAIQKRIREKTFESLRAIFNREADTRRAELARRHTVRRAALQKRADTLKERQTKEITKLKTAHAAWNAARADERRTNQPTGLAAFLRRITGIGIIQAARHALDDVRRNKAQAKQLDALSRIHARESREMHRNMAALARVEKRELRSLDTTLRRELVAAQRIQREEKKREEKAIEQPQKTMEPEKAIEPQEAGKETFTPKQLERLKQLQERKKDRKRDRDFDR